MPVEDSPALETQDSQLITEHQKEVREEQAQAVSIFPDLATGATRKSRRILGSPPLLAKSQLEYHVPDTPMHMQTNESPTVVPETIIKKDTTRTPELIGSFVSESHIASTSGSVLGSQNSSVAGEIGRDHSDLRAVNKGHSEVTDHYKDSDAAISHYLDSSQASPTKYTPPLPDALSDEPDGDDNFVDAPDHFDSDNDWPIQPNDLPRPTTEQKLPLNDIAELAVAISPPKDPSEYEKVDVADSPAPSPDTHICSEIMSATESPLPKANKKRGNKRKRPVPTSEGKPVDQWPEVLETIVIAEPEQPPASNVQSLLQQSPELERPSKKTRASVTSNTPVKLRTSARTTKGKHRGLRNATNRLVSGGTDLGQMSGKISHSCST